MTFTPEFRTEDGGGAAWTATVQLPERFTRSFMTPLDDGRAARTTITVVMSDDGVPLLEDFTFTVRGGLAPDQLRRPDLRACLLWAVRDEAAQQLVIRRGEELGLGPFGWVEMDEEQLEHEMTAISDIAAKVGRPRGPSRITDDFLAEVAEQQRRGDSLKKIADNRGTSQRTVRRWLAIAAERGLA